MKKNRIDFEIIPIFNQSASPQTWHDFTEIEMKCVSEKYNYHVDETDRQRIFKGHMDDWAYCKYNIAFAAYHGEQMVGFATAYKEDVSEIYLHNLYVDPQYEGIGIGKSLLEKTEKAACLVAQNMTVRSLNGALGFYESRGYTNFDNRNMSKKLGPCRVGVVPVFKWGYKIQSKLNVDVDSSLLHKSKYRPIFVYINSQQRIDGVITRDFHGESIAWVNECNGRAMADFYKGQLLNALSKVR